MAAYLVMVKANKGRTTDFWVVLADSAKGAVDKVRPTSTYAVNLVNKQLLGESPEIGGLKGMISNSPRRIDRYSNSYEGIREVGFLPTNWRNPKSF